MSYEDTNCPCGGKKLTQTMLCDDCLHVFALRPEMKVFNNEGYTINARRDAAIILCSLARKRKTHEHQSLSTRS